LKITTAAASEVRTRRLNSNGGAFQNLDNRREADGALHPIDSDAHNIAGRGKRNKQRQTSGVGQTETAGHEALDLHLESFLNSLTQRWFHDFRFEVRSQ